MIGLMLFNPMTTNKNQYIMNKNLPNQRKFFQFFLKISSIKKTVAPFIILLLLFSGNVSAQISTTVTMNGTAISGSPFASLASAINGTGGLNTLTITGPVLITCGSGAETAPVGGYNITATGTSINTITIQGNGAANTTLTAYSPQASGISTDAVIKITGGDYITISGFKLQENSLNTTTTAASNNMTEFGIAIYNGSATNGAKNNTIQNNTITLSATNPNTIGIFSNCTSTTATNTTGTNSNNKVYGNTITNVQYGIYWLQPGSTTILEEGNDIGGSSAVTGNTISFGSANTTFAFNTSPTSFSPAVQAGIYFRNTYPSNVSYNTITSPTTYTIANSAIAVNVNASARTGITYTCTISNNTITTYNTGTTEFFGINFSYGIATGTIVANNNTITLTQSTSANNSAKLQAIGAGYASASTTCSGNTITINQSTSGSDVIYSSNIYALEVSGTTTNTTVNSNTITVNQTTSATSSSGILGVATSIIRGIRATGSVSGTLTIGSTGNGNTVTIKQAVTGSGAGYSATVYHIDLSGTHGTVSIVDNTLNTTGSSLLTTGVSNGIRHEGIISTALTINNTTINVTRAQNCGAYRGIYESTAITTGGSKTVTNNTITITSSGSAAGTATSVTGIWEQGGLPASTKNINGNTINISGSTGTDYNNGISVGKGTGTINNNTITISNTASSDMNGILANIAGAEAFTITGNTLSLTSSSTTPSNMTAISGGATGPFQIYNNTISALNLTGVLTSSPPVSGIAIAAGTGNNVYNNSITNISIGAATSTGTPTINGVLISGGVSTNVYKNKVFGISTLSTSATSLLNGISITGGTTNTVYNNLIGNLTSSASNSIDAIRGISITSSTLTSTNNIYHNTINLNASSSGTNFGTSGVYHTGSGTSTTSNLDLRNNIIVNNSTSAGTGVVAAFRRSSGVATMLANYASTSNNNLFYAGTPSATNLIYTDGISTAQTIADYKSGVFTAGTIATRDNLSITENPTFASTTGADATYLHIDTTAYTGINAGAAFIATYTSDYDADTRSTSTPDIGADEFTSTNCLAPQATNLELTQSGTNINGVFSTSVPFANGYLIVRTDTNTAPVPSDGTSYAAGSTALGTGTYVVASGTSTSFTSTSLTSGNTYYYWVFSYGTQCTTNPIYNTTNPLTGNAVAPTPCSTPTNQPTALVLSTTSGSTISGSFAAAASVPSGYLVVRSTSNTEPTLTNGTLYTVGSTALGATTYVESVGTGITFSSTGLNPATPYYYYIFSYNSACTGEPFYLTSASSSPVVALSGSATTMSCITSGTYTIGATGNYSTITNAINTLKATTCAITGPVVFEFKSDYDSANEVYPITIPEVSGTSATNTVTFRPGTGVTTSITGAGIVTGALIYIAGKNSIIDGSNNGTTSRNLTITNTNGSSNVVIIGNAGTDTATALTNVTLKNTIIINGGYTYSALIISSNSGAAGFFNDITINNNSIRNALNGISANATVLAGNGSGLLINGNDINGSGANAVVKYGIQITGVDGVTVSNNNIANITSSTEFIRGIYFVTGTNSGSIAGNSISSLSSTGSGNGCNGIQTSSTTATSIVISNNTISGLSVAGTTGVSGISSGSPNVTINNNKISDIKSTTASSGARGIYLSTPVANPGPSNIYNNLIFDVAAYGSPTVSDNSYGIYVTGGGSNNIYYNTVNMNTNQTSTAAYPSAALYIHSTVAANSLNIKNNIFANTQTAGNPAANRFAIYSAVANTNFNSIDNNDYYTAGTNLGYIGGTARTTLANIVTGFGGNANSVNVLPSFTSASDLHLTTSGNCSLNNTGALISGITTDFDGDTRSTSTPDIGADEFSGVYVSTSSASSTPTLCYNTILTTITHTTAGGATGIGTPSGLPSGVTAAWATNTITISGTPSASGTFNYSIPLTVPTTGGCASVNATGSIIVNALPTALVLTGSSTCASTTGSITSGTSDSGENYQLYDSSNTTLGTSVAGSGSGLSWSSIAIGTGYYAVATNSTTGCVSSNSNSVAVSTITDKTWVGSTSNAWSTAANWSCNSVPTSTDSIIISSGSPQLDTNFTVGSGGTLTLSGSGTLTINPTSILTIAGAANFGDKSVIIKSDNTGTGTIGKVTGTLSNATNVTVERYIPAKRGWRALTAPVIGSTNASVFNNWQNDGNVLANTGVEIWSNASTDGSVTNAGNASSLLSYTSGTTGSWNPITNTSTTPLFTSTINNPFMVFVTGPYATTSTNITSGAAETTLKATGALITGPKSYTTVTNEFAFIGNPYASPLNLTTMLDSNPTFGGNIWVWDANVTGTYSVGTYNLFDNGVYTNIFSNPGISGAQIQSGQAFFVRSTDGASFSIQEEHKGTTFSNAVFRQASVAEILRVGLYKQINTEWSGRDGAMTVITANAEANQTANKMANGTENVAFTKNGLLFASEHHLPLVASDVLNVRVWNTTVGVNYKLKINTEQFATTGLEATLQDLYTNTNTALNLDGTAVEYPFTVTSDLASTGDRFRIVFSPTLSTPSLTVNTIKISPNPIVGDLLQVSLGNVAIGNYDYNMTNTLGQEIEKGTINHTGDQATRHSIKLRENLAAGIYLVKITGANNVVYTAKLIKQ